jgi:hypothetical protein
MTVRLNVGNSVIRSYKRLAYTPWHAIAEFVDNSTQQYFNHRSALDESLDSIGEPFEVSISYDSDRGGELKVADNSIGMSLEDLERALHIALPPDNDSGRSKYGMGMKTAACWVGNEWSVETKKLGEDYAYRVTVDVEKVAAGDAVLPIERYKKDKNLHYTIVTVRQHHRKFQGRTLGKIKEYLASMYRQDLRDDVMILRWQGAELHWDELDDRILRNKLGEKYKRSFEFEVDGRRVWGWAGVLGEGGRAYAGFSIMHSGRVVKGYPDSWRPQLIYGAGGRNDLINQRLVGEIHLDNFDVSHTKDDIQWYGSQEEDVETALLTAIKDYVETARKTFKSLNETGPSDGDKDVALTTLKEELSSPEMVNQINIEIVPSPAEIRASREALAAQIVKSEPDMTVRVGSELQVSIFIDTEMSSNDPYVLYEAVKPDHICVIVNESHPHYGQIDGSIGLVNYLRHCVYDAIAEWQASRRVGALDSDTVKMFKDQLLRVSFRVEQDAEPQP